MLLEFRVKNFRSFAEEQTLSLVASSDTEHEDSAVFNTHGHRILKSAAIYGANASGKSNFVRAIEFVQQFVSTSATSMNIGDELAIDPFVLSRDFVEEPGEFSFALLLDGVRYDYGFSATRKRVHSEWIAAYPKGHRQRWLERYYDPNTDTYQWECRGPLAKEKKGLESRTRSNGLAIARGAERNIQRIIPLFSWFRTHLRIIDQSVPPEAFGSPMEFTINLFREDRGFQEFVLNILKDADMGIAQLGLIERPVSDNDLPRELSGELRVRLLKSYADRSMMTWVSTHKNFSTGETADMVLDLEAAGTQRLVAMCGPLWYTLQRGYTLFVDELDCSMHPHLVRKLIQLFQSPEHNKSGAQLIFATHDSTLMDLSLLRRDQIWITEKNRTGASELYSLWDFKDKPRKQEAIQRGYLGGRYGGVPNFGPLLEAVE